MNSYRSTKLLNSYTKFCFCVVEFYAWSIFWFRYAQREFKLDSQSLLDINQYYRSMILDLTLHQVRCLWFPYPQVLPQRKQGW